MVAYDFAQVLAGLLLLVFAGDALVRGAVALSLRLGVSALIVSLTVVAFGTSAPELLVSIKAAVEGAPGLVYGNVVGSNIANILLVLGAPALISAIHVSQPGVMRNVALMVGASVILIICCALGGLSFWIGVAFLLLLCLVMLDAYAKARSGAEAPVDIELEFDGDPSCMSAKSTWLCIFAGLVGLPIGAQLLIDGARAVALEYGVSEAAIGLTLVAVGTSLPELATTIMAAFRKHADVAVGNAVGSNIFNILAVAGAAALFSDLPTPTGFLTLDLWVMLGTALLLAPFVLLKKDIGKKTGIAFLVGYVGYICVALH